MSEEIRIYVADQAAYNAGHLHGVWIDATLELDDIQGQVDAMLAPSPVEDSEEYAIHDFEWFDCYLPSRLVRGARERTRGRLLYRRIPRVRRRPALSFQ